MKKIYSWVLSKSKLPVAGRYLFWVSFLESSISPIPPDPLIIPMIISKPHKAWFHAFNCTSASVLGGILGYSIGYFTFEKWGIPILEFYGMMDNYEAFKELFHTYGFWAIVIKAFLPIPFKLATIASGAVSFPFVSFVVSSTISRGVRFYLEAALVKYYGPAVNSVIEKNLLISALALIGLLVGGFIMVKYII